MEHITEGGVFVDAERVKLGDFSGKVELAKRRTVDGIGERYKRYPVKVGVGPRGYLYLSIREKYVCDMYIETCGNYEEIGRRVTEEFKRKLSGASIKRWVMEREEVSGYLKKRLEGLAEINGEDVNDFRVRVRDIAFGDKRVNKTTMIAYKLYADLMGYTSEQGGNTYNTQVNILQKDGSR